MYSVNPLKKITYFWSILSLLSIGMVSQTPNALAQTLSQANPVQLGWFYKPPSDGNLAPLVRHFGAFILTKNDEAVRDSLIAQGTSAPFLQYVRLDAIHDPCSGVCPCSRQPYRNQVAWEIGDYCRMSQEHPDWFLLDTEGNRIAISSGTQRYVWMDPGNPAWRTFWLERVRQSQEELGWDGVFLDNVEASLNKYHRNGVQPALYQDAQSLQEAVEGFVRYLDTEYFQPQGRPLQGNIIEPVDAAIWFRYLQHLDGAMEEAFAVGWGSEKFRSVEAWEEHLQRAEQTQKLGKRMLLVAQGAQQDLSRQAFALASYLLISDGSAAFRYSHSSAYREAWLYDNYAFDLGASLGPRYRNGAMWQRDFANGTVRVDPLAHTAEIRLDTPVQADPSLHIGTMSMTYRSMRRWFEVRTTVKVVDQDGRESVNTSVTIVTKLPDGTEATDVQVTNQAGIASFVLRARPKGVYTATVVHVTASDAVYDPAVNLQTTMQLKVNERCR